MSDAFLAIGLTAVLAYLMGSLNFAVIISKFFLKDDVRNHGSGNAGFSNMMRNFGTGPAVATLVGDFLKGFLAVLLGRYLFARLGVDGYGDFLGAYCVMAGHVFPVFFGFKGGKAIASALGVLVAIDPIVFGILAVIFIPIVPISGYVSLASVLGACGFPVVLGIVRYFEGRFDPTEIALGAVLGGIVIFLHRANIKRLLSGTENKLVRKKPRAGEEKKEEP